MKSLWYAAILISILLFLPQLSIIHKNAVADEVGIVVAGAPPVFDRIVIEETSGRITITLMILDWEGWEDIQEVWIAIFDDESLVSNASFTQFHPDRGSLIDQFKNEKSDSLLPLESLTTRFGSEDVYYRRDLSIQLSFVYKTISGDTVRIQAFDKGGREAIYEGPFFTVGEPAIFEDPTIPILVSFFLASVASAWVGWNRKKNNEFATSVEKSLRERRESYFEDDYGDSIAD